MDAIRSVLRVFAISAVAIIAQQAVYAQSACCDTCCDAPMSGCASCGCSGCASPSIVAPEFGGCWCSRPKMTGNWHGIRNCWAANGVTVDADSTLFYTGVTSGGVDREFVFAGHNDYVVNLDMGKLAGREGLFVKLRAEHRYGESLVESVGSLLPTAISGELPTADSESVYLTNVLFTQALSESFAVFAGKLDTFDGDMNAFAHGRGKTQFSNVAFVATPIALRTVPYSTLGAGFVILDEGEPLLTFTALNPTNTTKTSGFDELFEEGISLVLEGRVPTNFLNMPGHQLLAGTWSSRDYISLGQDPRIILPNVPIQRADDSWSIYWNFDQYLVMDRCNPGQGWGVFGRAGIADDDTNPIEWFLSFGVGGNSMIAGRHADTFGVGWYRSGTSDEVGPILQTVLGPISDGQGVELFYNYAATPWLHITPDLQVIDPARETVDTAVVMGLRVNMVY